MKISTKGRYGLRGIIDLAFNGNDGLVTIKDIADRQGISANYLEQSFTLLRKGNLIRSVKGFGGGYTLSRPASQIGVKEILNILEGDLSIVDRSGLVNSRICRCLENMVWDKIDRNIDDILSGLTLEDMVKKYCDEKNLSK